MVKVVLSKSYWSELDKRNFYPDVEYEVTEATVVEMDALNLVRIKDGVNIVDKQREEDAIRSLDEGSSKRKRRDD